MGAGRTRRRAVRGREYPGDGGEREIGSDGADIRLLADASGWRGIAPEDIAETENPTLTLEAGTEYVLGWENGDGLQHNFTLEDENGEDLLATNLVGEQGMTQSVTFTASAEMIEYYWQVHPSSMRGAVDVR
ncbi:hypothetical protein HYG82_05185 [Natrinema halophilum]|nr:hypothetical protein [Natrinema halophilum]UHQ96048.1 hypothetical protein HYG82_05185 [Natrinema halophilum]